MAEAEESNFPTLDVNPPTRVTISDPSHEALAIAEYVSLRAEILKLIELQSQLVSLAVVTVGAILGVAAQTKNSNLAFVYPVPALILGVMWLNHAQAVSRCAAYLSQEFEPHQGGGVLGWERFVRSHPLRYGAIGYWGIRSVFVGSSLAATLAGWTLISGGFVPILVGAISSLLTVATIVLFLLWREPSPKKLKKEDDEKDKSGDQILTTKAEDSLPLPDERAGPISDHQSRGGFGK